MALEIRLLGHLEILRNGQALPLPRSTKTRALLAYLVATRSAGVAFDRAWTAELYARAAVATETARQP